MSRARSAPRGWLIATISPFFIIRCLTRSLALTSSFSASSLTVTPSLSATLPAGRLNSSTFAETGAACLRASRRDDGAFCFASSSLCSGMTMSGPRSSAMICVPENGPFVNSSLSTSTGRSLLPRFPVVFFFSGRSSPPSVVFFRRTIGAPGIAAGGGMVPIGRPGPPGRMPGPGRMPAPAGRAPIGPPGRGPPGPEGRGPPGPPGRAPIGAPGRGAPGPAGRGPPPGCIGGRTAGAWPA